MNTIILLTLLIVTFSSFWRDKNKFDKFGEFRNTRDRQRFFKQWTIEPFLLYGITSLVILWYLDQLDLLTDLPEFLKIASNSFTSSSVIAESDFLSGMLKGISIAIVPALLLGSTMGTIMGHLQKRKLIKAEEMEGANVRNFESLVPLNYTERWWGAILSINAGFSEELFFRVLAPILIYSVTGSAILAIVCSTLWFGLAHFYQGAGGVLVTFMAGLLLFGIYIMTQNIWIAMLVHAIIDLNSLVLSPWLQERFAKKRNSIGD